MPIRAPSPVVKMSQLQPPGPGGQQFYRITLGSDESVVAEWEFEMNHTDLEALIANLDQVIPYDRNADN